MHQNYVSKSAEGLSITFIVIWLAGDALNAAGAWFQGLLWTMVSLDCSALLDLKLSSSGIDHSGAVLLRV